MAVPGNVFSAIYGQNWPSPSFFKNIRNNKKGTPSNGPKPNYVPRQMTLGRRTSDLSCIPEGLGRDNNDNMFSLDRGPLHWQDWGSHQATHTPSPPSYQRSYSPQVHDTEDSSLFKITQNEFRRLSEQIHTPQTHHQRPPSGYKSHGSVPQNGRHSQAVYRSQLASSMKAFHEKEWKPFEKDYKDSLLPAHSRTTSSGIHTGKLNKRPTTAQPQRRITPVQIKSLNQRPRSGPPSFSSQLLVENLKTKGLNFDSLKANETFKLPESEPSESLTVNKVGSTQSTNSSCTTSGLGSDLSKSTENLSDEPDLKVTEAKPSSESTALGVQENNVNSLVEDEIETQFDSNIIGTNKVEDSDDSDDEKIPEPKVEEIEMSKIPDLVLRPEQLDAIYEPPAKGSKKKYDFDARNVEFTPYEFAEPLAIEFQDIDVRDVLLNDKPWRKMVPELAEDSEDIKIFERVLELETLQMKTEIWEKTRKSRANSAKLKPRNGSVSRINSAKIRDRKCCPSCLQPACVGDCPDKVTSGDNCILCKDKYCTGICLDNAYEQNSRTEKPVVLDEEKLPPRPKMRPKSCNSCQKKHNAKLINANNLIMGRPHSSQTTYSLGRKSMRPKMDIGPKSMVSATKQLDHQFEKLGIDPYNNNAPIKPTENCGKNDDEEPTYVNDYRIHGRATSQPGKSYFSQRRHSITNSSKRHYQTSSSKSGRRRLKSGKKRNLKVDS